MRDQPLFWGPLAKAVSLFTVLRLAVPLTKEWGKAKIYSRKKMDMLKEKIKKIYFKLIIIFTTGFFLIENLFSVPLYLKVRIKIKLSMQTFVHIVIE